MSGLSLSQLGTKEKRWVFSQICSFQAASYRISEATNRDFFDVSATLTAEANKATQDCTDEEIDFHLGIIDQNLSSNYSGDFKSIQEIVANLYPNFDNPPRYTDADILAIAHSEARDEIYKILSSEGSYELLDEDVAV